MQAGSRLIETAPGQPWAWNPAGAITPVQRYAQMRSGAGVTSADGTEWYYPERLTIDSAGVGNGIMNPAQTVLGEDAIHGSELPTSLHIHAINSELDTLFGEGFNTLKFAEELAEQSKIPSENLTLVDVRSTYPHNDTNGAFPSASREPPGSVPGRPVRLSRTAAAPSGAIGRRC